MLNDQMNQLLQRLDRIEATLTEILGQRAVKEWYIPTEVAAILHRAEYTVREWCRCGRAHASKQRYARGAYPEWMISHTELTRIQNEGLLPLNRTPPR